MAWDRKGGVVEILYDSKRIAGGIQRCDAYRAGCNVVYLFLVALWE